MKPQPGDKVWLKQFDNGDGIIPPQRVTILEDQGDGVYLGEIHPDDYDIDDSDGINEFDDSQIDDERGAWE